MPKGYLMANIRIKDQEIFKEFSSAPLPLLKNLVANFLSEDQCRST